MKKIIQLAVVFVFLVGCASMHPGQVGVPVSQSQGLDLKVSSEVDKDNSDENNKFINVTFENKGGNWIHVDKVELEFPSSSNSSHNLIVGKDLEAWAESQAIKEKVSGHNTEMGIASLLAAGAVLMVASIGSNDANASRNLGWAGLGLYGAGAGIETGRKIGKAIDAAEKPLKVPENHVYAPISLPAKGYSRKWLLVNIPNGKLAEKLRLTIHTVEGLDGTYEIPTIKKVGANR